MSNTWPTSPIGNAEHLHSPPVEGAAKKTSETVMKKVYHPSNPEKVETVSTENARDMVRLDGWKFVYEQPVEEQPEAEEFEDNSTVPNPAHPDNKPAADTTPNDLDKLRTEYTELSEKEADKRWGKAALEEKIASIKAAKDAQTDND